MVSSRLEDGSPPFGGLPRRLYRATVSIWLNAAVSPQTWLTPLVDAWIPNILCLSLAALLMRRVGHTRQLQTF